MAEEDIDEATGLIYASFQAAAAAANAFSNTARHPSRTREIVQEAVESEDIHAIVATVPAQTDGDGDDGELIVGFNCLLEANAPLFGMGPLGIRRGWQGGTLGAQRCLSVTVGNERVDE